MPEFGFSFVPFNEVVTLANHEFLIDVIGVLTEVFPEKQYEKDGRLTNMVVMELTDSIGKLECALFGDYIDQLRSFINQGANVQDGLFIVLGNIVDIIGDGDWFYLACKCNKSVSLRSIVYFCDNCDVPVLQVSPRFKVKVKVVDDSGTTAFVLFDRDVNLLLKKTCEELLMQSFEVPTETGFPHLIANLIGRRLLFKIETKAHQNVHYGTTYAVRRISDNEHILAMFEMSCGDNTPMKATFAPPFSKVDSTFVDLEGSSSPYNALASILLSPLEQISLPLLGNIPQQKGNIPQQRGVLNLNFCLLNLNTQAAR